MLQDALQELTQMAVSGMTPERLPLDPHDPSTAYVWNPKLGAVEKFDLNLKPRAHTLTTLQSLVGAYSRYTQDSPSASVWISLTQVVVILDDGSVSEDYGDRQNRLVLPLKPSPIFETLAKLPSDQKGLVLALRHDLRAAGIAPENFESVISKLHFEQTSKTDAVVGTVRSTLARERSSEVNAAGDIPPELSISFEPFPSLSEQMPGEVTVECSVVVDTEQEKIIVRPFPGQLDLAQCDAIELLRARLISMLGASEENVFAGSP